MDQNDELIARIKLNIKDKCQFLDGKGRCTAGCWLCELSQALILVIEFCKEDEANDEFTIFKRLVMSKISEVIE